MPAHISHSLGHAKLLAQLLVPLSAVCKKACLLLLLLLLHLLAGLLCRPGASQPAPLDAYCKSYKILSRGLHDVPAPAVVLQCLRLQCQVLLTAICWSPCQAICSPAYAQHVSERHPFLHGSGTPRHTIFIVLLLSEARNHNFQMRQVLQRKGCQNFGRE